MKTSVIVSGSPHIPYSSAFPLFCKWNLPSPQCQYTLSGSSPFGRRSRSAFCTCPCSSCTALCDSPEEKREEKTSRRTCRRKLTKGVKKADLLVLLETGKGLVEHGHEVQGVSGETAVILCEAFCTNNNNQMILKTQKTTMTP